MATAPTVPSSRPPVAVEHRTTWTLPKILLWIAIAILGGISWTIIALVRGESVNAIWFVFAALSSYAIAYRFYARFIAERYGKASNIIWLNGGDTRSEMRSTRPAAAG